MARRTIEWAGLLDFERALSNCRHDLIRDWYYDPWGWPELAWVAENHPEVAIRQLEGHGAGRVAKLDVAKENFSVRPAVILDPTYRLVYQALVDQVSVSLIGDMSSLVFGWRLPYNDPTPGIYALNEHQYENFRLRLTSLANDHEAALKTDIASCFASVPIDRLAELVFQVAGQTSITDRLVEIIRIWDRVENRSGVVQRSLASCVLVNCFLEPLDEVLSDYAPEPSKRDLTWGVEGRSGRWMDDLWLFDDDLGRLRHAQYDLQSRMNSLGLRMNTGKTEVIEGRDNLVNAVLELQHSAIDEDLDGPKTLIPLNELIASFLQAPETANRTSVRFATHRMRKHQLFERVHDFMGIAHRMPHAADGLSRLFRDSGAWREMQDWFTNYSRSDWGVIDWAVAQFGRMFPTKSKVNGRIKDVLTEEILSGRSIATTALACQRLARWAPEALREAIRARRKQANSPLERRALALGGLSAGENPWLIRELLKEFEESAVTLDLISERSYKPFEVVPDFSGD